MKNAFYLVRNALISTMMVLVGAILICLFFFNYPTDDPAVSSSTGALIAVVVLFIFFNATFESVISSENGFSVRDSDLKRGSILTVLYVADAENSQDSEPYFSILVKDKTTGTKVLVKISRKDWKDPIAENMNVVIDPQWNLKKV